MLRILSERRSVTEALLGLERKRQLETLTLKQEGWERLPDTMPMLVSTAVQVEEPMKSHVRSVDEV